LSFASLPPFFASFLSSAAGFPAGAAFFLGSAACAASYDNLSAS